MPSTPGAASETAATNAGRDSHDSHDPPAPARPWYASRIPWLLLAFLAIAFGARRLLAPAAVDIGSADVTAYLAGEDEGFERVTATRPLVFPADEGAHPAYQTEWWYYTGNLEAALPPGGARDDALTLAARDAGRRFGFQLTFFRSALEPDPDPRDSAWGSGQAYLAHFTVSDVADGRFHSAERLARGGAGLAGAEITAALAGPRVWLESWSATGVGRPDPDASDADVLRDIAGVTLDAGGTGFADPRVALSLDADPAAAAATRLTRPPVRLRAADGPVAIDLTVTPAKPAALHGDAGYSVKGDAPGNASFYYSWSRLEASGTITTADGAFPVAGAAWMDHEWSTSALAEGQRGWDWFSLQLDDDTELMAFQIREQDGGIAPRSSGSIIDPAGAVKGLSATDFAITVLDTWTSPRTGGTYPSGWRLVAPDHDLDLTIRPLLADQELAVSFRYWEGAVEVEGSSAGRQVSGYGYVEMTGYAPTEGAGPGL